MKRLLPKIITSVALIIVLIGINIFASNHKARFDMTSDGSYSLSEATKALLKDLKDIVTIQMYFTKDVPPALLAHERSVEDLIEEYRSQSNGHVKFERIDPNETQYTEQTTQMLGIPPVELNVIKQDRKEVVRVYLGLAVMYGDKQEVMPIVQRTENLEYELDQAIIKVTSEELPIVGWWEETPRTEDYKIVRRDLQGRYKISEITIGADLQDRELSALIIVSPRKLTTEDLKALDQYIVGGGKVFALIDTEHVVDALGAKKIESPIFDMFTHYGITVNDDLVADRSNAMATFSGGYMTYQLPYPYWVLIPRTGMSADAQMLASLEMAVLPWTSSLTIDGNNVKTLLRSTSDAVSTKSPFKLNPKTVADVLNNSQGETLALAAMLDGQATSYFNKEQKGIAQLIVVGDSRFAKDMFISQFPANLAFFGNAVDSLAIGNKLMGVRARVSSRHPIAMLSDRAKSALRYMNVIFAPILVIGMGLLITMIRKMKRRRVAKQEA